LPEQSQPSSAERDSNAHLAFTRSRTGEQHRGEIRACDQQDKKDRAEQDEQRRTQSAYSQVVQRQHVTAETAVLRVILRMLAAHLRVDHLDLRLRLGD
jgi:hypothetical protein